MKRGRKMLAFIVLIGVLSGLFCGCNDNCEVPSGSLHGVARQINDIKNSGYIKIGVCRDNKPFGYLDENGEYQGFDVYFARRIGKDLGVNVQLVPVDAEDRSQLLENGELDLVMADYAMTSEENKLVDFAMPYMKTSLGIVSSLQNKINRIGDLADKVLIVITGSTADWYFRNNHPDIKLIRIDRYEDAVTALKNGLGDALCTEQLQALALTREDKGYVMGVKVEDSKQQVAPAVQKENVEMVDYLNQEIETFKKENLLNEGFEQTIRPLYGETVQKDDVIIE